MAASARIFQIRLREVEFAILPPLHEKDDEEEDSEASDLLCGKPEDINNKCVENAQTSQECDNEGEEEDEVLGDLVDEVGAHASGDFSWRCMWPGHVAINMEQYQEEGPNQDEGFPKQEQEEEVNAQGGPSGDFNANGGYMSPEQVSVDDFQESIEHVSVDDSQESVEHVSIKMEDEQEEEFNSRDGDEDSEDPDWITLDASDALGLPCGDLPYNFNSPRPEEGDSQYDQNKSHSDEDSFENIPIHCEYPEEDDSVISDGEYHPTENLMDKSLVLPETHALVGCLNCKPVVKQYTNLGEFDVNGTYPEQEFWDFSGKDIPTEAFACENGIIHIKFPNNFTLSLTVNCCARLVNNRKDVTVVLSPDGQRATMLHPSGTAVHTKDDTRVSFKSAIGLPAKACLLDDKGVYFGACLTRQCYRPKYEMPCHLLTANGLTSYVNKDVSIWTDDGATTFKANAMIGPQYKEQALDIIAPKNVDHWVDERFSHHFKLSKLGMLITQHKCGGVVVTWEENGKKFEIKNSPRGDAAWIQAPFIKFTASVGNPESRKKDDHTPHVYALRGTNKVYFGSECLKVMLPLQFAAFHPDGYVSVLDSGHENVGEPF